MTYALVHVSPYTKFGIILFMRPIAVSKFQREPPECGRLVHGVGKCVTFDRNHCISRKQYDISMDRHIIDHYSEIIAGRSIHQCR